MSDTTGQQKEPTMEEILASIRRIISEEGDGTPSPAVAQASSGLPSGDVDDDEDILDVTDVVNDDEGDDGDLVLDLTEMVSDDGSVVDLTDAEMHEEENTEPVYEPEVAYEPEPVSLENDAVEPEPAAEIETVPLIEQPVSEAPPEPSVRPAVPRSERSRDQKDQNGVTMDANSLISDSAKRATEGAFAQLTHALNTQTGAFAGEGDGYQPQGVETVEGMVYAILKPMLKSWIDQNLPVMVEKMVQAEIEKLTSDGL